MGRGTPYLRFAPVANLHITLLFLGDVAAEHIQQVSEVIKKVCRGTPVFQLVAHEPRYAPDVRQPRMVWLPFEASSAFASLRTELAFKLRGFAPHLDWHPRKRETPHVTLARFKASASPHILRRIRSSALAGTSILISSALLFESTLTPEGARYEEIAKFPFAT